MTVPPPIAVIMAVKDAESTLHGALCSIEEQSYMDFELIAVDDGSTDGSLEILRDHEARDPRVRVICQGNPRGSGAARNRAIAASDAEYVAIMDADDLALPDRLGEQLRAFHADGALEAVSSQLAEFGSWGGPVISRWPTAPAAVHARQRSGRMPIPHPSAMFRRRTVVRVGGYDEACLRSQDFALMLRLRCAPIACLPAVHVLYRTQRPLPLSYALRSGRYAHLARQRAQLNGATLDAPTQPRRFPRALPVDLRSSAGWLKRSVREMLDTPSHDPILTKFLAGFTE